MADTDTTKPATPAAKPTKTKTKPAFALHRINGLIEPGDTFCPASDSERDEMASLEAIRDLSEAEQSLFDKVGPSKVLPDADPLG